MCTPRTLELVRLRLQAAHGDHILRFGHAGHVYVYQSWMLEVARLSGQAAHGDQFQEVVTDRPSDSLVVVTEPHWHVWH